MESVAPVTIEITSIGNCWRLLQIRLTIPKAASSSKNQSRYEVIGDVRQISPLFFQ
jgi:hypothetical protein